MIDITTPVDAIPFVIVDVETTGLSARSDSIVEIAAVRVMGGRMVDHWSTLVSIDRVMPPGAQRVNGITNEMLVGQPPIDRVLPLFFGYAGEAVLVEHSWKAFDVLFLERAHGGRLAHPYLNTCTLSRKLFPFHRSHSLGECCKRHNIANNKAHRALGDARASAELLLLLLQTGANRYRTLGDLTTVASVER